MTRIQQEYLFLFIFVLLPLVLTGIGAVKLQFPWYAVVGGIGFSLMTGSWFAIYLRVRRELPDHPLAKANYFSPPLRDLFVGTRLVTFYNRHYGLDMRSSGLLIGLAMFIALPVTANIQDHCCPN